MNSQKQKKPRKITSLTDKNPSNTNLYFGKINETVEIKKKIKSKNIKHSSKKNSNKLQSSTSNSESSLAFLFGIFVTLVIVICIALSNDVNKKSQGYNPSGSDISKQSKEIQNVETQQAKDRIKEEYIRRQAEIKENNITSDENQKTQRYNPDPPKTSKKSKELQKKEIQLAQDRIKEEHNRRQIIVKENRRQTVIEENYEEDKSCSEVRGYCYGESYYNGNRYYGDWQNGIPNGKGTMYLSKNEKIEGRFVNGLANGNISLYINGHRWDGQFKDNNLYGCGIYYYPNGKSQPLQYIKDGWYVCNPSYNDTEDKSLNAAENETQSESNGILDFLKKKPKREISRPGFFGN